MFNKDQNIIITSHNQSGGITAQTVNVNQPAVPEWGLEPSEKISSTEWRTKLWARCRGSLAAYNWNILLTLSTAVLRREDVPGEVTVGPWMPLQITGAKLEPTQFFIGFSEFKPGQGFANYLYSTAPIKILNAQSLA